MKIYVIDGKKLVRCAIAALVGLCILSLLARPILKTSAAFSQMGGPPKLAIVIDDFGSSRDGVKDMLALEIPITAAVMPFCEHTLEDAELALSMGKEVIIHMPMEAIGSYSSAWLGEKAVLHKMSEDEIKELVNEAIKKLPFAVGMNNHMGSRITEDMTAMKAITSVLEKNGMFFLDSKTSVHSVGEKACKETGANYYSRDIFLDGKKPLSHVKSQMIKAAKIALEKGKAIAIGHVGVEGGEVTARAILETSGEIRAMGVEIVFLSQI